MYTFEGRVRYSEVDAEGKLPVPGIVDYFQDCSVFQSEDLGVGVRYLASKNRAWVLNSWQIIIERFPLEGDLVRTSTWASGFERLFGLRNFTMKDENDGMLAYANSYWVYMDLESGRPVKASPEEVAVYAPEPRLAMEYEPRKIKLPQDWQEKDPVRVPKSWIDSNHHVNNSQYVRQAWNQLPLCTKIRQVRVEYKNAAKLGDLMIPRISGGEERIVAELCDESRDPYAVVEFKLEK
ncbi:acyl-[acyl-carrier-protein] thioesterase [Anaerostipes sp.]|uniref:acyl-[acyl-carrier-protein] thioesterase n=1 Tax=Anaerostipes sp. TaxID=1872530 RepID=UPI0025C600BF|nr:acyl-ACP thioesterase domain-containing protein [Anaerostipes sp.]MBS7008668.1 acyl-[acyl-carrier-protein] thioesterase [Anaerostipes sp.]